MIANREQGIDDYLAMARRRLKVFLIPLLPALLVGFLLSYAFTPKYTSRSLVMVEGQRVPEGYVKPVVTDDLTQRIAMIQQQVLSHSRLKPMVERLGLAKESKAVDAMIEQIRQNLSISAVQATAAAGPVSGGRKKKQKAAAAGPGGSDFLGFYVSFTAQNPRTAQQICGELTSMMLDENLKARSQLAQGTTDFLARQVEESKRNLDDFDNKLATFKKRYVGQLPGDADTNLKILMGLNSQLEANTQTLNRAQQDKSYSESLLTQQVALWKSQQSALNPQTLEQKLAALQSQLLTLQTRYTPEHPDVVKAQRDIADLKSKLKESKAGTAQSDSADTTAAPGTEPVEVRQLRQQIHQYEGIIAQAGREQQRLQQQISLYQGRVALSPEVEQQYKELTRDYDSAQRIYNDLLAKKSQSEMQTDMERRQQGEQMSLLNPADLPESPSSPVRWMFAAGGLGTGLAIGFGLALWLELRDRAMRTEQDVQAVLELPTLVAVPWVAGETNHRTSDNWRERLTLAGG